MRLLSLFVTFILSASEPPAATVPQVRRLRAKLGKVLVNSAALSQELAAEAKHADDAAAQALRVGSKHDLEEAVHEFATFSAHLSERAKKLREEPIAQEHISSTAQPDVEDAAAVAHAAALVPDLEAKVKKVLAHLLSDKVPKDDVEQQRKVVAKLERALKDKGAGMVAGSSALAIVIELHESLKSAHEYLKKRSEELSLDRERLAAEIEEQQVYILYMMLRQRRKLPLKAQLALLRRHQFQDCAYAQKLLKVHGSAQPLCDQLLVSLPKALAENVKSMGHHPTTVGSLAAAGSDGRVQIVSSRMKNAVRSMAAKLASAKEQLAEIVSGKGASAAEKTQAQDIMKGIEEALHKVSTTNDLNAQLDAMSQVQNKLKMWMSNAK